jgi:hypothetical protein
MIDISQKWKNNIHITLGILWWNAKLWVLGLEIEKFMLVWILHKQL